MSQKTHYIIAVDISKDTLQTKIAEDNRALVDVAPFNRDSGKWSGKLSIQAGREKARKCLYMAAHTGVTHNPAIKPYVGGLTARGKPYKCAVVAAMIKLLILKTVGPLASATLFYATRTYGIDSMRQLGAPSQSHKSFRCKILFHISSSQLPFLGLYIFKLL